MNLRLSALIIGGAILSCTAWAQTLPADAPVEPLPLPAQTSAMPVAAPIAPPPSDTERRALATSSATADVAAQQAIEKDSPIPQGALEVTATGTLEWLREDQMYVAKQNAAARHNGTVLKGDVLVAHYQTPPGKKSGTEITLVTADGNPVEVIAPTAVAYGQHGTYDVPKHLILLTGDNLKLVTTDEVVTAKNSLEYFEDQDTGVAKGDAVMLRSDGDKLTADSISAKFVHNATADKTGKTAPAAATPAAPVLDSHGDPVKPHSLETLHAVGHVVLVTQTDIVTGDEATYNPIADQTTVVGKVHITREANQLDGARAEVDMSTGISRMFAAPGGKVHGLFVPQKKESKDKTAANTQDTTQ
jgi:lipopolysaccharide export system protein LptA